MNAVPFYPRLRNLRKDANLLQKDVAQVIRCSQRTYSDYERGVLDIPTEVLIWLADFYATTTDYLLGRSDNHETQP